ncbi:MAG: hypothetical protein II998_01420 [Clostridia bacterium]|nr:hypothetical protein [Clostridia bacterium]
MKFDEKWIWLPEDKYPNCRETKFSAFDNEADGNYTVAEFKKDYCFEKTIVSAKLIFSGDTSFVLYANEQFVATGPASTGGDYLDKTCPGEYYSFEMIITPNSTRLSFYSIVKMGPWQIYEYSKGHGGFMLCAFLTFEDGSSQTVTTDSTWLVRKNNYYISPVRYDSSLLPDNYVFAEEIKNIWCSTIAPIPVRDEEYIYPVEGSCFSFDANEENILELNLDRIYAGFVFIKVKTDGKLFVDIICKEYDEEGTEEKLIFTHDDVYRGFMMHSAGKLCLNVKNLSLYKSEIEVAFISTYYPVLCEAKTVTDNDDINLVLDVCAHTLKICRQTHHLDSPKHCEPLCCTGDYYIETMMNVFSFGDTKLSEFDVLRTAMMIEKQNGKMFHTTYSLIWVRMLWDVYMLSGNAELLKKSENSLDILLNLFETYVGCNGLIETPPDYMFVDWIYVDELSVHHPPKALGQTALNMYYYMALDYSEKIYRQIGENKKADKSNEKKLRLKHFVNTLLFDTEKRIYFEGLNTPTPSHLISKFMPENTSKRYYLKHSNILSVYTGVCEKKYQNSIIDKIMNEEIEGDYQPYFAHYLLEAIFKCNLTKKYTLKVIEKWIEPVKKCPKGLVEGFVAPEPSYRFDHSHAWGGTPLYSLPKALMGLEINKVGFKEITLSPSLLGFEFANVNLPTPYGMVELKLKKGEKPVVSHPDEIKVNINQRGLLQ